MSSNSRINTQTLLLTLFMISGLLVAYNIGHSQGTETTIKEWNMHNLRDFQDLITLRSFLAHNKIDENEWIKNEYTCYTFSTDLVDAARIEGYRAQVVIKNNYLGTGLSHAQVQFWVEESGVWIIVEPQNDGLFEIETSYTKYGSWGG